MAVIPLVDGVVFFPAEIEFVSILCEEVLVVVIRSFAR
jgi:hypothetical protein